jgi:hypothetical protein
MEILPNKKTKTARRFWRNVIKAVLFNIKIGPTDNDKEFTDRYHTAVKRARTGNHEFNKECKITILSAESAKPQKNGMLVRLKGRTKILRAILFDCRADLEDMMLKYQHSYNHYIFLRKRWPRCAVY